MHIVPRQLYRIKGNSEYFASKYGTPNPTIIIEDTDHKVFGKSWGDMNGNPACMLFGFRMGAERGVPPAVPVYYGHISMPGVPSCGELVCEDELEEVK